MMFPFILSGRNHNDEAPCFAGGVNFPGAYKEKSIDCTRVYCIEVFVLIPLSKVQVEILISVYV